MIPLFNLLKKIENLLPILTNNKNTKDHYKIVSLKFKPTIVFFFLQKLLHFLNKIKKPKIYFKKSAPKHKYSKARERIKGRDQLSTNKRRKRNTP
jgi:hypothetical protein